MDPTSKIFADLSADLKSTNRNRKPMELDVAWYVSFFIIIKTNDSYLFFTRSIHAEEHEAIYESCTVPRVEIGIIFNHYSIDVLIII